MDAQTDRGTGTGAMKAGWRPGAGDIASIAAAVALSGAIVWSYRSSFSYLMTWWEDSNYSHGWIIIPIALAILWQRREMMAGVRPEPRWWGLIPLVALLGWRYVLYERNEQWFEAASVPLVIAATFLAVGGLPTLRWSWPGLTYLIFMIPLPPRLNEMMAGPLQSLATAGAVAILQMLGQPVLSEGNVIRIGTQTLEVAEACRGLSMLLSFGALIAAMVILVRRPLWERAVLLASFVPIALLCNIIRIATTAVVYAKFNRPVHTAHDYAGYAMMVLALGLILLELKIMSWLVVEEDASEIPSLLRTGFGTSPGSR